jgi:CRISPR-associated endonuclease Csy4
MDYYVDIYIKLDSEMRLNVALNTVYTKLHKILHDLASTNIGVSFPKYNVTLGNVLRIHGEKMVLHDLLGLNIINDMNSNCEVSSIKQVPGDSKFRTISRKQTTMTQSKMRRLFKRGSMTEDDIRQYKNKMFSKGLDNPYFELVSESNGHKYRRYIEFGELLDQPTSGNFDRFGLSKTATIPWFD